MNRQTLLLTTAAYSNLFVFGALTNNINQFGELRRFGTGPDGNLYGSALNGGPFGDGTIFKLTPAGAFTVVAWFDGLTGDRVSARAGTGWQSLRHDRCGRFRQCRHHLPLRHLAPADDAGVDEIQPASGHQPRFLPSPVSSVSGRNYQMQAATNLITPN